MQTENEGLTKLRNRIERPRDWSATLRGQDSAPICIREVTAWNWEHALSEMKKFCQSDTDQELTIDISTLRESEDIRSIQEVGNTQTHYLGNPRCSELSV